MDKNNITIKLCAISNRFIFCKKWMGKCGRLLILIKIFSFAFCSISSLSKNNTISFVKIVLLYYKLLITYSRNFRSLIFYRKEVILMT